MTNEIAQSLLKASDWVMIGTALFLGACALFVPYLAEIIKRKWFAPNLKIKFSQSNPFCHLTRRGDRSPVYYFRFEVKNEGKSQAKFCEAVLEELWVADISGKFIKEANFSPINLKWSGQPQTKQFIDINPERELFCDIGHISSPSIQNDKELSVFYKDNKDLKFFFETPFRYFSQQDCVLAGNSKIKISIYCENAPKVEKYFQIFWSGKWKDNEVDMFKEIIISSI
jgi:hypothetical protein